MVLLGTIQEGDYLGVQGIDGMIILQAGCKEVLQFRF
jgi:hypothetical protein